MRVLLVVPPLVGHVLPLAAVGAALERRGHQVAWVGHREVLTPLLPTSTTIFDVPSHLGEEDFRALTERGRGLRGAAAFRFLWADFFWPLADAMVPVVEAAVAAFRPDVVVSDQQAFAGSVVARRQGLAHATSAATSAALVDPLDALPQLRAWMHDGTAALAARHGVVSEGDGLLSPQCVLAFTTEALVGAADRPASWHFVGPVLGPRRPVPFPYERLRVGVPAVLATLGTVSGAEGGRFFQALTDAVRGQDVQIVAVVPDGVLVDPPPNVITQRFVPQLDLLGRVDAVLCHAGHNTVVEALWHDRPLIVAPVRDDQPVVAQQVVSAGAGVRVKFGRVGAEGLAEALRTILHTDPPKQAAARIGASFRGAGGADAAVGPLEALAKPGGA